MTFDVLDQTSLVLPEEAQDLLFRKARTVNAFTDEPVTDEQLQQVYDLVKWGPTAMNMQSLRVLAVRSKEQRAALAAHMSGGNKEKTVAAPLTLVFGADLDFHDNLLTQYPAVEGVRDMLHGQGRPGRTGAAKLNAALAIAYWFIGLRSAGLAVGPMTGADFDAIAREFFPGERVVPMVVANVGHADHSATYPRGPRLDLDEVLTTV